MFQNVIFKEKNCSSGVNKMCLSQRPCKPIYSNQRRADIDLTLTPSTGYQSNVGPSRFVCKGPFDLAVDVINTENERQTLMKCSDL